MAEPTATSIFCTPVVLPQKVRPLRVLPNIAVPSRVCTPSLSGHGDVVSLMTGVQLLAAHVVNADVAADFPVPLGQRPHVTATGAV